MKETQQPIRTKFTSHSLTMTDRQKANMTGVSKVDSAEPREIVLTTCLGRLVITGADLKIVKFDDNDGNLALSGSIDGIKYTAAKQSLLKRIFK